MEREDFLNKLFDLYANSFSKKNGAAWAEAYNNVLKPNFDYDKLYETVITTYAGANAPSPAFLLKNAVYVKTIEDKSKDIDFKTILATKNGIEYECGQTESFAEAKYNLEKQGFSNVRYKFENKNFTEPDEFTKSKIRDWVN